MSRHLLLQSILGHMDLLAEQHPDKAASLVARRAKRYVKLSLQGGNNTLPPATPLSTAAAAPARPLRRAA